MLLTRRFRGYRALIMTGLNFDLVTRNMYLDIPIMKGPKLYSLKKRCFGGGRFLLFT